MSNTNTLPPELEAQIDAEATNKTMKLPANNSFDVGYMQGMENGYIAGATEYAQKATTIFEKILNADWAVMSNEITIGPELINEIKSFLNGSK